MTFSRSLALNTTTYTFVLSWPKIKMDIEHGAHRMNTDKHTYIYIYIELREVYERKKNGNVLGDKKFSLSRSKGLFFTVRKRKFVQTGTDIIQQCPV